MRLLLLGDLILDEPDPDSFFEPSRALLRSADLVVGQVEVPHTARGVPSSVDIPAPPADPRTSRRSAAAGLGIATLAGNHIFDSGPNGDRGHDRGAARARDRDAGAGMTLEEARRPAVVDGVGVLLSYNCVGPRESRATSRKAGARCARRAHPLRARLRGPGRPAAGLHVRRAGEPRRAARRRARAARAGRRRRRRVPQGHRPRPGRRARLRARARPDGDRLRRRRRRRPPRAHPARHRGLPRQAGLPRPRELRRRHARADAVGGTSARRARRVGEAAARALRVRARPGDAVLSLPPGEPEHDDRRLPDRRAAPSTRASCRAGSTTAGGRCRSSAATRSRPTSSGSRARPASTRRFTPDGDACVQAGRRPAAASPGP